MVQLWNTAGQPGFDSQERQEIFSFISEHPDQLCGLSNLLSNVFFLEVKVDEARS
jgi:hypothetical protein